MSLLMTAGQIQRLAVVSVRGGEDVIYSPEADLLAGLTLTSEASWPAGS